MKIETKKKNNRTPIILILSVILLVILKGFVEGNFSTLNPEFEIKRAPSIEEKTFLGDQKTYLGIIGNEESLVEKDGNLEIHIVRELDVLRIVYIYNGELEGRQMTDRFFLHIFINDTSYIEKEHQDITFINLDFKSYFPLELEKDGKKYSIFSRALVHEYMIEDNIQPEAIKRISTGRNHPGVGKSVAYRKIKVPKSVNTQLVPEQAFKKLKLVIDEESYKKIIDKRNEAIVQKILVTEDADLVDVKLIDDSGNNYKAAMRLKGDWVDHLEHPSKWSFRVIIKGGQTFEGMRKFSFQHPKTRNYSWEWFFHKLNKKLGVIGLRYNFYEVDLEVKFKDGVKKEPLGIMAMEEAFDKILIENNLRREGIVIAFDESIFWNNRIKGRRLDIPDSVFEIFGENVLEAPIKVFNQSKVLADSNLSKQFSIAKDLLDGVRTGRLKVSEAFDLDKLTTYTALCNLFGGWHGLVWHNVRIYYNPVTNLLEPIVFDNIAGKKINRISNYPFAKFDSLYQEELMKKLRLYSDGEFVNQIVSEYNADLEEINLNLGAEFDFFLDKKILIYNSNFIKNKINPTDAITASLLQRHSDHLVLEINNIIDYDVRLKELKHVDGKKLDLKIKDPFVKAGERKLIKVELSPYFVNAFISKKNKKGEFRFPKDVEKLRLIHEVAGVDYEKETYIIPYALNRNLEKMAHDYRKMFRSNIEEFDFASVTKDSIVIKSGKYKTDQTVVIPKNTKLVVEQGFELDLKNEASFISFSDVHFRGTKEEPVKIYSSDGSGRGVFVSGGNGESKLEYSHFENLSYPKIDNWSLSGSVNFNESDVNISHSTFSNNRSEDCLNIIRSNFILSNSVVKNTQSDAFDGDFVKGKIVNSQFINCGNDGVDVSGSIVELQDILIESPQDKAISGGESSSLTGKNIKIRLGEIGIVSKDKSTIELDSVEIIGTRLAVAAFQKKSEFGAGKVSLQNVSFRDNEQDHLIEEGSSLLIDQVAMETIEGKVIDQMYGREYGKSSK